ncbi:MAG: NERD domain-containing protein, partial [Rhodospirillaceae bacterium]|nr:NERD domain-containing protein [Rhodospirillaceae bacterium]
MVELFAFAVVLLLVARWALGWQSKGQQGEQEVRNRLGRRLDKTTYQTLNNITLAVQGTTTQIDNIVVSRFGVFVIETKNMSGWIFGA